MAFLKTDETVSEQSEDEKRPVFKDLTKKLRVSGHKWNPPGMHAVMIV